MKKQQFAGPWPRACQITGILERENKQQLLQWRIVFVSKFINKLTLSRNGFRNDRFQEKESEMDSEMSSCCCFLLRLLFLVQKTAHARGAVREPPGLSIVTHQRLEDTLFLKRFPETFLSPKITIVNANGIHYGTKRKSFGSYFWETMQKWKSVFGLRRRVRIAYEPIPWKKTTNIF